MELKTELEQSHDKVKEAVSTLESAVAPFEAARPAINSISRFFEAGATVVAWQVAVVSPGFLGLLWNARTLAQFSRLDYRVFNGVFVASELCFLAAIISAMVLHNFLSERALQMAVKANALESIKS